VFWSRVVINEATELWLYRLTMYTVFKKLYSLYFCDNFVGHEPILIIFGKKRSQGNWQHAESYVLVIDSIVLQLRTSLSVAGVAENGSTA